MKGGAVRRNKFCLLDPAVSVAVVLITALSAMMFGVRGVRAGDAPVAHIPSYVEWTPDTIATASGGDPFRGLLLSRHCAHCHGAEGFSQKPSAANLAGMDRLVIWKQLQDFRSQKRMSFPMNPIAQSLSSRDVADLAAYYWKLPIFYDPDDNRAFPQPAPDPVRKGVAWRLVNFGDGERGIPPCQSCHGPVAFRPGAPSLITQNSDYVLQQLEDFATRTRANDINEAMRTIAGLLSDDERHALAEYYGAGLGMNPGSPGTSK